MTVALPLGSTFQIIIRVDRGLDIAEKNEAAEETAYSLSRTTAPNGTSSQT